MNGIARSAICVDWGAMRFARSLALAGLLALAGCAGSITTPVLGGGPGASGDPRVLDDAMHGVQAVGYQPLRVDPAAGRFVVLAQSDRNGLTQFAVQCFREGFVSIVPDGPGITQEGERFRMPGPIAQEYRRLAFAVSAAIEVRR